MSRIAKNPIFIPSCVDIKLKGQKIFIKGKNGELTYIFHRSVTIEEKKSFLCFSVNLSYVDAWAQAGTCRALVYSMIIGVTEGFSKKLQLIGVGYRVSVTKKNVINMSLGYSHPIEYTLPFGVIAEIPSQTEIILKGADKQLIGQVAANLRAYRVPEPYKGKGIRYENEIIRVKEAKKK
ncbi:50S ribosomal protein L6 [Buchnera aphidicola (Pemphigus obesinymphae)]|uniref:50S ribosomal protein L6 n=1 Tax=Buchnera aphidicola TaxID=9 RepID=UPI002238FD34|nr:50S ribosomal protein L6 [Buchnera aphidicola]MCW5196406.1 50S ribosomal protein L6 [Buchnera aphidicola (Pemphigus obesinymphae)]